MLASMSPVVHLAEYRPEGCLAILVDRQVEGDSGSACRYVDKKTVHKHEKESAQAGKASFSWAWLLDERPEERARGG